MRCLLVSKSIIDHLDLREVKIRKTTYGRWMVLTTLDDTLVAMPIKMESGFAKLSPFEMQF